MISYAALRGQIAIPAGTDVAVVEALIEQATTLIETQTRRYFHEPEIYEERCVGNGTAKLWISEASRDDDGDLEVDDISTPGTAPVLLVEGTDFERRQADNEYWLVRLSGVWATDHEYNVRYTRGYAIDQGPGDVERVVVGLVALWLARRGREGLRSESVGDYSYTRFGDGDLDALDGAQATIKAWRRLVVA